MCGMIVSNRYATLHELQSVYGVRDLFDLTEIICVDGYNTWEANRDV